MENDEKLDLRKYNQDQLCVIWKQVIRLRKQGYKEREIAEITGLKQRRVSEIWTAYLKTGKQPLPKIRGRKVGEKRLLSPEREKEIKKLIVDKDPNQLCFSCFLWTANTVRELIKQRYGLELGKQTVREYLENWGMTVQSPIKQAYHQNAESVFVFRETVYPEIKNWQKKRMRRCFSSVI